MLELQAIIGSSREITELRALIKIVGPSDATVMILGDSGTGKELVAKALHGCSDRAQAPFIPINCGAIPKDLLESELFGHRKGAFTGAITDRKGRFELANGGTLFLDEIGDMSMDLQVKLLRVLQERTIDPVGSTESKAIDVRVIAATHKNVEQLIQQGEFREDLFYRLNVMPMEIQALDQRKVDIPLLIEHFAALHSPANKTSIRMTSWSLKLMVEYDWPGNVRELSNLVARYTALYPGQEVDLRHVPSSMIPAGIRNLVDQQSADALSSLMSVAGDEPASLDPAAAVVAQEEESTSDESVSQQGSLAQGVIEQSASEQTPTSVTHDQMDIFAPVEPVDEVQRIIMLAQGGAVFPEEGMQLKQHLLEIERTLIKQALGKAKGNVSKTARLLNLQRTTLIEKINKYGLSEA
ncbi:MAG: sigma-54 dependent transcriptional regulator [Porticoccaceae bacterium]|nr:sigma-54 dependent transcriptional regulator [Porticoccaceae bacterium]MDG1312303.1 sigma-54 dependent transcriptional regulator [Porticoccaceae bacterium]